MTALACAGLMLTARWKNSSAASGLPWASRAFPFSKFCRLAFLRLSFSSLFMGRLPPSNTTTGSRPLSRRVCKRFKK